MYRVTGHAQGVAYSHAFGLKIKTGHDSTGCLIASGRLRSRQLITLTNKTKQTRSQNTQHPRSECAAETQALHIRNACAQIKHALVNNKSVRPPCLARAPSMSVCSVKYLGAPPSGGWHWDRGPAPTTGYKVIQSHSRPPHLVAPYPKRRRYGTLRGCREDARAVGRPSSSTRPTRI